MADPRYQQEAAAAKKMKGQVTFLHYLMARLELDLLISIAAYLQRHERTVRCLIYDGLLVELKGAEVEAGISPALLRSVEAHVLAETGCAITLASKEMRSCYHEVLKTVPRCIIDDDYAAGRFVSLYGEENLRFVQGAVHAFNKASGQWESSEGSMLAAVHTHKDQLVFKQGKKVHNYGGCATNIKKMLGLVSNYIETDDEFWTNNIDSSKGKLLFKDGIYDFDTDTFSPGFDSDIVFASRINRNFDRCHSSAAKAELMKVMWEDPYTGKPQQDGVPMCERMAFARALYGDYEARKMYIVVGDTATGKGLKAAALENSCGSFVGSFDIANFVHNPYNGADAAKQLSWLQQIVYKRIALSSEARENAVLCGKLIKSVVSGGDSIQMRGNYQTESSHKNRSTLFMMCNDVPKIQPMCDAVQDRQGGVFEMQVRFMEKPNPFRPDHEKPRDTSLKSKLSQPEYQAAFLSTLLDAYQQYKKVGHVIPASVSAAIQDWVADDSSLESLLHEVYESKLDPRTREPLAGFQVAFDEIYQHLVVDGVGPEHRKVSMTKTKLGRQLEVLGFKGGIKKVNGKNTRVRLGLAPKQQQQALQEDEGDF